MRDVHSYKLTYLSDLLWVQQVELQVKRRMGIGSFLSERRLIDEIMRTGLGESTVSLLPTFDLPDRPEFVLEPGIMPHKTYLCSVFLLVSYCECTDPVGHLLQIRRALIVMAQRDEIEYRRERRVIVRKA